MNKFLCNTRFISAFGLLFLFVGRATVAKADDSLSGNYHDEKIALSLEPDGTAADRYRGFITTGGHKYPLSARLKDGTLSGAFHDDAQNSFDFSAILERKTLTLKTGSATYRLAADGPAPADPSAPAPAAESSSLAWVHEGLLLNFSWTTLVAVGTSSSFEEDEEGKWMDSAGHRYDRSDRSGTGATGVSQVFVTCLQGDKVVLNQVGFADARPLFKDSLVPLQGSTTSLAPLKEPGDYWIEPAHLASLHSAPEPHGQGILVTPVEWKVGDRKIDAIRVLIIHGDSYSNHVFDRKTGLCLHYGSISKGIAPSSSGRVTPRKGTPTSPMEISSVRAM